MSPTRIDKPVTPQVPTPATAKPKPSSDAAGAAATSKAVEAARAKVAAALSADGMETAARPGDGATEVDLQTALASGVAVAREIVEQLASLGVGKAKATPGMAAKGDVDIEVGQAAARALVAARAEGGGKAQAVFESDDLQLQTDALTAMHGLTAALQAEHAASGVTITDGIREFAGKLRLQPQPTIEPQSPPPALDSFVQANATMNVQALVQWVLREAYVEQCADMEDFANKVKAYNAEKKALRAHMAILRKLSAKLATVQDKDAGTTDLAGNTIPGAGDSGSSGGTSNASGASGTSDGSGSTSGPPQPPVMDSQAQIPDPSKIPPDLKVELKDVMGRCDKKSELYDILDSDQDPMNSKIVKEIKDTVPYMTTMQLMRLLRSVGGSNIGGVMQAGDGFKGIWDAITGKMTDYQILKLGEIENMNTDYPPTKYDWGHVDVSGMGSSKPGKFDKWFGDDAPNGASLALQDRYNTAIQHAQDNYDVTDSWHAAKAFHDKAASDYRTKLAAYTKEKTAYDQGVIEQQAAQAKAAAQQAPTNQAPAQDPSAGTTGGGQQPSGLQAPDTDASDGSIDSVRVIDQPPYVVSNGTKINTKAQLDAEEKNLDDKLNSIGGDSQLANVDLQNALQREQQTLQMMSNVSKLLNDTAMAIIRKIGA